MRKAWLAIVCLLAACATANSLQDAADRADRLAEAHELRGDGAGARKLHFEADSYRARAELLRKRPSSRVWADATLH